MLISPETPHIPAAVFIPDVTVATKSPVAGVQQHTGQPSLASSTVIEAEEACETDTHYSLIIRRAPENRVVAALVLLSPWNKGLGNRWDREKHLRKRAEYLDAGVSLLEIDAIFRGDRDVPAMLTQLTNFERIAWTAYHFEGRRKYRGWGWNLEQPLPQIDTGHVPMIDLQATLQSAAEFNQWADLVGG